MDNTSFEYFVNKIKPAMDGFLRVPNKNNLLVLNRELENFKWSNMKIFQTQILLPLFLKLEEMNSLNQDLLAETIDCIRFVVSKLYVNDIKGLCTMLIILLRQIQRLSTNNVHVSEELKLAVTQCIAEIMRRSTTDILESFYTDNSEGIIAQILLMLVGFVEKEKYKKIVLNSLDCLMVMFYVHDEAEVTDVVLRSQIANVLFIFMPKVLVVLYKTSLSDEKLGDIYKTTAIRALGRILHLMYEDANNSMTNINYDVQDFNYLINESIGESNDTKSDSLKLKVSIDDIEDYMKKAKSDGRSQTWIKTTSKCLRKIFVETKILRSNESIKIRREYANMNCNLILYCTYNMRYNFVVIFENVLAMSEDKDEHIQKMCQRMLSQLLHNSKNEDIFNESAELLLDEYISKFPRIINRCVEEEQYAELLFLKAFLHNLNDEKLLMLLSTPKNLEKFCILLISAVDLKLSNELLIEEYALRKLKDTDYLECSKLHWQKFKYLVSSRCIQTVQQVCAILGNTNILNLILFDYFINLLNQQHEAMNEIILIMTWMATSDIKGVQNENAKLIRSLLEEILNDKHWYLASHPDTELRLNNDKSKNWFVDRTPGLYESAVEITTQDRDPNYEIEMNDETERRVSIRDAQFNVLHTCVVLNSLGCCANSLGDKFDKFVYHSLHKVLLKTASSNCMIYQASMYTIILMQRSLKFAETQHFIENYTDYIIFHLHKLLKKFPQSRSAVDILTVVLQLSSSNILPHLEPIFNTISDECSKMYQFVNINSYLRVFLAFLEQISNWKFSNDKDIENDMFIDDNIEQQMDFFTDWLNILKKKNVEKLQFNNVDSDSKEELQENIENDEKGLNEFDSLPRYIKMVKDILNQILKFLSSTEKVHQILALDCLNAGIPLLKDYENELLPLVHLMWDPLMERFQQMDPVILNRSLILLNTLSTYAKDFIMKRSLDGVIPFLKRFLQETSYKTESVIINAKTQEYKLKLYLLQEFSNLVKCMQINGQYLEEISDVISLYLSEKQPTQLQANAVQYFNSLWHYNGPFVYLILLKKCHLLDYKQNFLKIINYNKIII